MHYCAVYGFWHSKSSWTMFAIKCMHTSVYLFMREVHGQTMSDQIYGEKMLKLIRERENKIMMCKFRHGYVGHLGLRTAYWPALPRCQNQSDDHLNWSYRGLVVKRSGLQRSDLKKGVCKLLGIGEHYVSQWSHFRHWKRRAGSVV